MTKPIKNNRAIITSGYGTRTLNGVSQFHGGIDIAVPGNPFHVPVYATMKGKITAFIHDEKSSCGNAVFIKPDGKDFYCLYFHLDYINPDLAMNEEIKEGEYIGAMGNTGHSFGMHLHYGHRKGMESGTETIDPQEIRSLYT